MIWAEVVSPTKGFTVKRKNIILIRSMCALCIVDDKCIFCYSVCFSRVEFFAVYVLFFNKKLEYLKYMVAASTHVIVSETNEPACAIVHF